MDAQMAVWFVNWCLMRALLSCSS